MKTLTKDLYGISPLALALLLKDKTYEQAIEKRIDLLRTNLINVATQDTMDELIINIVKAIQHWELLFAEYKNERLNYSLDEPVSLDNIKAKLEQLGNLEEEYMLSYNSIVPTQHQIYELSKICKEVEDNASNTHS